MAISDKLNEKELEIGKVSLYVVSLKTWNILFKR